ncbi:MAG: DUF4367 domain-containing protein [Firmicutes bacterium]|nr:DUF4367 domain-containing protein [Bacillota bacterium]
MRNRLNEAIIEYLDDEIAAYALAADETPGYNLSKKYLRKKRTIIRAAEGRETKKLDNKEYIPQKSLAYIVKIRRVAVLVAVLIMLLAAAVGVVAAVKAYIRYNVDKGKEFWHVTFEKEGYDDSFIFEYLEPKVPEGFEETTRIKEERFLLIRYSNSDGSIIEYAQQLPDGLDMYIDNIEHASEIEYINGIEVITTVGSEGNMVVFNDERYLFDLSGTVSEKVLKDMAVEIIHRIRD